jgi:hypothetical protein
VGDVRWSNKASIKDATAGRKEMANEGKGECWKDPTKRPRLINVKSLGIRTDSGSSDAQPEKETQRNASSLCAERRMERAH